MSEPTEPKKQLQRSPSEDSTERFTQRKIFKEDDLVELASGDKALDPIRPYALVFKKYVEDPGTPGEFIRKKDRRDGQWKLAVVVREAIGGNEHQLYEDDIRLVEEKAKGESGIHIVEDETGAAGLLGKDIEIKEVRTRRVTVTGIEKENGQLMLEVADSITGVVSKVSEDMIARVIED